MTREAFTAAGPAADFDGRDGSATTPALRTGLVNDGTTCKRCRAYPV